MIGVNFQLPSVRTIPWCQRLPDVAGIDATLYLAHVVTDLTAEALKATVR